MFFVIYNVTCIFFSLVDKKMKRPDESHIYGNVDEQMRIVKIDMQNIGQEKKC